MPSWSGSALKKRGIPFVVAGNSNCRQSLAREFEPNEQTIRNWIAQADLDEGRRRDGLTTVERAELRKLRKENRQLRVEREILAKAAAWFARESDPISKESSGS